VKSSPDEAPILSLSTEHDEATMLRSTPITRAMRKVFISLLP
jgi:hypothetical protein